MPRSGKRPRREALSAERIEQAALELIEGDGLEEFSIRKLAAALGCEAMSIYHYFPSRQHLMDALVDRVLATMPPTPADLPPLEMLRQAALDYRAMALRFPRFQQYLAYHRLNTPGGIRFIDRVLRVLADLGIDQETTARLFRVFGYYVSGAALDETAGYAKGPSAAVPLSEDAILRDHPLVAAANPYFQPAHHEKTFLVGLDILLDGISRTIARADARDTPTRKAGARSSQRGRRRGAA